MIVFHGSSISPFVGHVMAFAGEKGIPYDAQPGGQAPGRRMHESGLPFDDPSDDCRRPSWRNTAWLRRNP